MELALQELRVLGQQYRGFMESEDFKRTTDPDVMEYFGSIADEVLGAYAQSSFYHITHAASVPSIQENGLQAGVTSIRPEHREFFLQAFLDFHQGRHHPADLDFVRGWVLTGADKPRGLFLTGQDDGWVEELYVVPESVKFFVRNLHYLSRDAQTKGQVKDKAAALVSEYCEALTTNGKIEGAVIKVDVKSPELAKAILGRWDFRSAPPDVGLTVLKRVQRDTNIKVNEPVPPDYLTVVRDISFPADAVIGRMLGSDAHVVFRRSTLPLQQ